MFKKCKVVSNPSLKIFIVLDLPLTYYLICVLMDVVIVGRSMYSAMVS